MSKRTRTPSVKSPVAEIKKARPEATAEVSTEGKPGGEKSDPNALNYLQIIITGPRKCGKSCLVLSLLGQLFPPLRGEFLSKQYLHFHVKDENEKNKQSVMIWDLDSREEFSEYRKQSYKEADYAFLCFDVRKGDTLLTGYADPLQRSLYPWIRELEEHCKDTPIVLVGLKGDLRNDLKSIFYSQKEIDGIKSHPKIKNYVEVSAHRDKEGVKKLFKNAIDSIEESKPKVMFSNRGFELLSRR